MEWKISVTRSAITAWTSTGNQRLVFAALLLAFSAGSFAAEVLYEVSGVDEILAANVRNHVQAFQVGRPSSVEGRDGERIVSDAVNKAYAALRPYGYYAPVITAHIRDATAESPVVAIEIDPGPPVLIDRVEIELLGDGATHRALVEWKNSWPLTSGQVLDQIAWEERKSYAIEEAEKIGYLASRYTVHKLEIDLETNRASIALTLDTGKRFVFGDIEFGEHVLKPGIVEYIPRFEKGDWYSRRLLNEFRIDLWKSGYFTNVEVEEISQPDEVLPEVDLKVTVETTTRNHYQGSLGAGSDTGTRVQAQWSRHPMSSNGDRIDVGVGWQEQDDEFSLRSTYRLPRRERSREYWTGDLILRNENLDLEVKQNPEDDDFIRIANGKVDEYHLRAGRLKVRNFKGGEQQAFETLFVQGLKGNRRLTPVDNVPQLLALVADPTRRNILQGSDSTLSIGVDYDLVGVYGKGWETRGHRERAWIFHSNEAFGSNTEFTQVYASTRRSYLRGERWKFILRAEVGYTDAEVDNFAIDIDGQPLNLSVTRLPNFYRFKAGGSNSVRGYGFEELSNNLIGSNHIITGSAEVEMKFLDNWSAAAFFDIGNAFNDWEKPELRKGAGIGFRWYSIAGPIRVDFARALDIDNSPWRVHFTIGTPLL